jgi:hypothetical protein
VIRDLTGDEIDTNQKYTPIIAEARNRLLLFRILDNNFKAWRQFLEEVLSPKFKEGGEISDELNRLLLNYLSCAYSIREHFEKSYQQRFRHDPVKKDGHDAFITKLCEASWPFAFFLDFRGYVQHVGLAVGRYDRRVEQASVSIEVAVDAKDLTSESRDWKRSKLDSSHGEIDLITNLQEFHIQMLQNYATYVVKTFFSDLFPASEFYRRLTEEVKTQDPFARMFFFPSEPKSTCEGTKTTVEVNYIQVPNDLFAELNIQLVKKASGETPVSAN